MLNVTTIGGGPGGLYASILLKKANPEWDITVHERNPPGVTYGWGIVLPDRTLTNLKAADEPSYEAIVDQSMQWKSFDLYYQGDRYRSSGHSFASMLRTDLLELLQDRCRDLGVTMQFESEIDDPRSVANGTDLLIGSDGIHSETRTAFADEFGTETIAGSSRFSWFGTGADFDALSHIFVQNDDGIWCAHTYPGPVSTFIVDCDAETWANAELDQLSEANYRSYLEDVFVEHLDGNELRSQIDRWQRFTTVKNQRWFHNNVVLIGDAAHTAHYSIGSGTTIAMEDAIALSDAVTGSDVDVETALGHYEQTRRSSAESLQHAGERSRIHFEDIRRYFDFDGIQFTLHHLTRTGRLTYDSMSRRDPELVEEFEQWFAAETPGGVEHPEEAEAAPPSTQPMELRDLVLPNRAVRVLEPTFASSDGQPTDSQLAALSECASEDVGLTMTGPLAVSKDGRPTPGSPGLYRDKHARVWEQVVSAADRPVGTTLLHAGSKGGRQFQGFALEGPVRRNEPWAPKQTDQYPHLPRTYSPVRMTDEDLKRVQQWFVGAARRADEAGFEYLQLQLADGYLLGSFLSPVTNGRTDEYGGDIEERMRFPIEILTAVRNEWPASKPLGAVLPSTDRSDGGFTLADSITVANATTDTGIDILAPVAGGVTEKQPIEDIYGLANFSDILRNEVGVPTVAAIQATTSDEINTLVGTSRADLCTYYGPIEDLSSDFRSS